MRRPLPLNNPFSNFLSEEDAVQHDFAAALQATAYRRVQSALAWLLFISLVLQIGVAVKPALAYPNVTIHISGDLTESQRSNIHSHLSLARIPENEALTEATFNRLYAKIPQETAFALEPFGYYVPNVEATQRLENQTWHVEVAVSRGQPVTIQNLDVAIAGPGEDDPALQKAIRQFPMHLNDIFDHQLYEEAKEQLIAVALDSGYFKAAFRVSRVEIRKKTLSASVNLKLDTGPRYVFGHVTFVADFIDHDLLRKISPSKEGDPLSPKALARLRQSLYDADYFTSVELEYDIDQAATTKVPITVTLTPNLAHKYGIGLGYGTDTGARGTFEYSNRHLNRFGHQLDLQWQPSEHKSQFGGVYSIPVGDPKRDRLSLSSRYAIETFASTDTNTWTSAVSRDHFRDKGEYSTELQFLDEQYKSGSQNGHAALLVPGIKGSIFWADDRITTSRGLRVTGSLIGAEQGLLSDASFLQATVRTKGIYSFFKQWRCIGRADLGTTFINDIYDLPPSLRFYAGGDQSVRGYGYKTISPTDANGNILGGRNMFTYSLELERALFDQWHGAVFYDSGTVTNSFSQFSLQSGIGIGVRWNAPFGQIRVDLATPLEKNSDSWRIHLTMGADL